MDRPQGRDELLHDVKRVEYHKGYLASLARAIRNGADVRGYFVWGLMDNFEWLNGYTVRFGLYYVNFQTLQRIPKLSARWYMSFLGQSSYYNMSVIVRNSSMHSTLISST
ncbi:hypothetical protein L1049_001392 [Liquidambar formosana]|uniref:Beta-glucosidase n=1 Tax=Liquidambar formosana TaxID=63359 RepID=A0AAP0ND77_LIQFO